LVNFHIVFSRPLAYNITEYSISGNRYLIGKNRIDFYCLLHIRQHALHDISMNSNRKISTLFIYNTRRLEFTL